jgi:hypothetical protein
MKVELIEPPKEITHESILAYLASCSSVVRDAQPKNNERLFKRLQKESFGDKPSRVFEYVPCKVIGIEPNDPLRRIEQLFGFKVLNTIGFTYYTNARELLNWGWSWDEVLGYIDFTHYKAVKVTAPYFLYGQMSTHNQITSVSHSNRYTQSKLGYWYPPEFEDWYLTDDEVNDTSFQVKDYWDTKVLTDSPQSMQIFMKNDLGIKRREVFARGSDMLEIRVYTLGGYTHNPNGWEQFINQRLHDSHTQLEMRQLAKLIDKEVNMK